MIALALKALGLMRVSEHEAVVTRFQEANVRDVEANRDLMGQVRDALSGASAAKASLEIADMQVRACHDARNALIAKFKRAATDLAAQAEEIEAYGLALENSAKVIADHRKSFVELTNEIASLRPDAQKWRDYLKRSRDRKAGKKS